jgi:uncharacterized protein YybS (DUF2232 family)
MGAIFLIFIPLILFFYGTFAGKKKTAVAFLIPFLSLFPLSMILQFHTPYLAILTMALVGLLISTMVSRGASIEKIVIYPALLIVAVICSYFFYRALEVSANPWQLVSQLISETIEENIKIYSQLPIDKEDIAFIIDHKLFIISTVNQIFPALIIVAAILVAWINIVIGKEALRKIGITNQTLQMLSHWKAPEPIIWAFLLSGALLFISHPEINFFSRNLFIITCFIYLLQGFAILSFLFQNKRVPVFFRYFFYFLIAIQQILVVPIALAGLFDIWVDFRRFFQKDPASST